MKEFACCWSNNELLPSKTAGCPSKRAPWLNACFMDSSNLAKSVASTWAKAYKTTNEFLKMFGLSSLDELPELPRYKIDENEQIVLENFLEGEETASLEEKTIQQTEKINMEGNNNE